MMRALWSAASGMTSQQTNVDVIANNLANVNTTGYKKETAQFKTLLYQTVQSKTTSANGETKPVGAQIGLGVRNSAITSIFTTGNFTPTDNNSNFAIDGNGFFSIQNLNGETLYTRDGSFNWTNGSDGTVMLANSQGYPVLDVDGNPIVFPAAVQQGPADEDAEIPEEDMEEETAENVKVNTAYIEVNTNGEIFYRSPKTGDLINMEKKIGLYQFANPAGLSKEAGTTYAATGASGEPISEEYSTDVRKSVLKQSYVEASNVNVADEMVNLIVAQRAYEMNSKAIQASDDMLGQANQLKR